MKSMAFLSMLQSTGGHIKNFSINPGLLPPSSRHDDVSNPRLGFQESDHSRYPKKEKEQPRNGSAESITPPPPVRAPVPTLPRPREAWERAGSTLVSR